MGSYNEAQKKERTEVLPAKCIATGADFDIIIERRAGDLILLEGKKRSGPTSHIGNSSCSAEKKTGLKSIEVNGSIFTGKTYHCPICGNKDIVRCGYCHNITCYDRSGTFECAHCGYIGKVYGSIQQIHVHDSGSKSFSEGDKSNYRGNKPYYPGDKPGKK